MFLFNAFEYWAVSAFGIQPNLLQVAARVFDATKTRFSSEVARASRSFLPAYSFNYAL